MGDSSPLGFLKLLGLFVCDEDGCLGFLTLSVIELHCCFFFGVGDRHTRLLKAMLAHSADIREFHVRVVAVLGELVALGAEVNVGEAALVLALLSDVHLGWLVVSVNRLGASAPSQFDLFKCLYIK